MSLQLNSGKERVAPENEQAICLECGLCCDGTLFGHAELVPGEKGNLPDLIEQNVFTAGAKDYFRLPCLYFKEKCTIYGKPRAEVCGSYRCRLLSDMSEGKISPDEALETVRHARETRDSLASAYIAFSPANEILPFAGILMELGKSRKNADGDDVSATDHDIIQARCNIFEALLIRHFRPSGDFEKIVMKINQEGDEK